MARKSWPIVELSIDGNRRPYQHNANGASGSTAIQEVASAVEVWPVSLSQPPWRRGEGGDQGGREIERGWHEISGNSNYLGNTIN